MNRTVKLLVFVVIFALVIGGAYVLYERLGADLAPDQLSTQAPATDPSQAQETAPSSVDPTDTQFADTTDPVGTTEPALQLAPDFQVFTAEGDPVQLHDYFGKPMVLNFWASWCGPCKSEMPEFHEKYLELGDEVQFLMVNMTTSQWETFEEARSYIEGQGFTFPVLYDRQGQAGNVYGVYSLPTTYFLDAEGYLIAQATGAIDGETLQRGIDMIYDGQGER